GGGISSEPAEGEPGQIEARFAARRHGGERLAYGRRVLESVARAWRRENDAIERRMPIQHEAEVGSDGIEAHRRSETASRDAGEVRSDTILVHRAYFVARHVATNRFGIVRTLELFGRDLYSAVHAIDRGETVDAMLPAGDLPDEDRAMSDSERRCGPIDRKPEERLTIHAQERREL